MNMRLWTQAKFWRLRPPPPTPSVRRDRKPASKWSGPSAGGWTGGSDPRDAARVDRRRVRRRSVAFQVVLPVRQTAPLSRKSEHDPTNVFGAIEAQGWTLAHANYVYEAKGTTQGFMGIASVTGNIVGIYIFRRAD